MAVVLDRPSISDEINAIPFEEPKKWSELVRQWPDEKWWGDGFTPLELRAGRKCSLQILWDASGHYYEVNDVLGNERERKIIYVNDFTGKYAAANLLESWGL